MFQHVKSRSTLQSAVTMVELIYHSAVRDVRKGHGNAFIALASSMLTTLVFLAAFYLMFTFLGLKGAKIRGDFLLYMLSGIFVFLTHIQAVSAVLKADGPSSPMMQHAPMNTIVSIAGSAISSLYIQVMTLFIILFAYHVAVTPFVIDQPVAAFGMVLLGWFTGVAVGLVLMAIRPWFPGFVSLFQTVYRRVNMIASGKLFVVNTLPTFMLNMFDWNPLFHIIDQCRGFVFGNYFPRNTSLDYPIIVGLILIVIGLMGEFYTRQYASSSWEARR